MIGLSPVGIIFWGAQCVAALLMMYALFEWGLALSRKVRAGALTQSKAYNYFGFAAVFISILPVVVTVLVFSAEPIGGTSLVPQGDDFGAVRFYIGSFVAGLALQILTYIMFFIQLKRAPKA